MIDTEKILIIAYAFFSIIGLSLLIGTIVYLFIIDYFIVAGILTSLIVLGAIVFCSLLIYSNKRERAFYAAHLF